MISVSGDLLLVCSSTTDISVNFYPATLPNSIMNSNSFSVESLGYIRSCHLLWQLDIFWQFGCPLFLFPDWLGHQELHCSLSCSRSWRESLRFCTFSIMLMVGFNYTSFIMLRFFPSIPNLLMVLDMKGHWIPFLHLLWWSYVLGLPSFDVVYWFGYVESSLHPLEESHLIMGNDHFNVLLNSLC